jgi:ubiquinone/menaquinone biosynthesis C-methylase UbiE
VIITNRQERKKAVQEIARVLKSGGWLGIIDSFQHAAILTDIGWENIHASGRRFHMFPPVKWTTGIKPKTNRTIK